MLGTELIIPYCVFQSGDFHISTNSSYVENNPDKPGFWCVAGI